VSHRYKKEHSVAFKIRQNPFSVPRPHWGSSWRSPGPLVGWGLPTRYRPTFGTCHASPRIPARYTPMRATVLFVHCVQIRLLTGATYILTLYCIHPTTKWIWIKPRQVPKCGNTSQRLFVQQVVENGRRQWQREDRIIRQ